MSLQTIVSYLYALAGRPHRVAWPARITAEADIGFVLLNRGFCPKCGPGPSGGLPLQSGIPWICVDCATMGRVGPEGMLWVPAPGELVALMLSPDGDRMEMIEKVVKRQIDQALGP